jgi:pimeloyl-ACP methyl ester carboxylesterase
VSAIWGAQDVITPFDEIKPIFEKLDIPFKLIEGCGHSPMYERPEEFAEWVNQCLVNYQDLKITKVA